MKGKPFRSYGLWISIMMACYFNLNGQVSSILLGNGIDTLIPKEDQSFKYQKDLIDLFYQAFHKNPDVRLDSTGNINTHWRFSVAPIVEFTIATGFSPGIGGNVAFLTSAKEKTNTSTIVGAIKYTQKKQFLFPLQSAIWTPGNKFNLVGDWRYLNYPQDIYGFGGFTTLNDKYILNYQYLRLYELVLKSIRKNLYLGFGYQLDYHWGIKELDVQPGRVTDFEKYGFSKTSISSGFELNLVYDSRENSINPEGRSVYVNLEFSQKATVFGSDANWNSVIIDLRKYFKMPFHTVLALWSYNEFILGGNPPYLDLPGTGSDTYNNTGRGYEQSRFIGKKMVDLEAELRFKISRNGLVGGVIFGNAESLSELGSNKLEVISPAVGIGLRIKFNKFSGTNACLDYGIGTKGSRGFVGNLGEVF
ncbi:MAG: hypothetical protein ACHQF0_00070 [Chitinophagales bacterium]